MTHAARRLATVSLLPLGLSMVASATAAKKEPIYVSFFTHQQRSPIRGVTGSEGYNGEGPAPYSRMAKNLIDLWEKYEIKGEYATTGVCLQQLLEDFPETVEKIKRLKIPVTRYGGVGHEEPCPVGRMRSTRGMTEEQAIVAEWEFETRTLTPDWRLVNGRLMLGNPLAGKPMTLDAASEYNIPDKNDWLAGGTLAIEQILGIIPMDFFQTRFSNLGRDEELSVFHITPVKRALGMSSFDVSTNQGNPLRTAPPMRGIEGLDYLAKNMPRDRALYVSVGDMGGNEELIKFVTSRPDDFKVVWPDPEANQWKSQNSASAFFKKTYGLKSIDDVLQMPCPVDKIRSFGKSSAVPVTQQSSEGKTEYEKRLLTIEELKSYPSDVQPLFNIELRPTPKFLQPSAKTVTMDELGQAADYLLVRWPLRGHDNDPGGPPDGLRAGKRGLSLADAFQGFAYVLEEYSIREQLPTDVTLQDVLGPVDYPMIDLVEEPKFDPDKVIGGYQPLELDVKYFHDKRLITSQGLEAGPVSVNEVNVLTASTQAAESIRENQAIPATVEMFLPRTSIQPRTTDQQAQRQREEQEYLKCVNAAELLYAMAQEIRFIRTNGMPAKAVIPQCQIIRDQLCKYIMPATPVSYRGGVLMAEFTRSGGFLWRKRVSPWVLNAAWNYVPSG